MRVPVPNTIVLLALMASGCALGPKAIDSTHQQYNESLKRMNEEQMLLNLVRLRYNDDPMRLDVASIATQYEITASAEARPFYSSQAARFENPSMSVYDTFTSILPFAGVSASNRPTISMTPLDDPETMRAMFRPSTLEGIVFLAESGWPISTMFRLYVEYMNGVPNAVSASGPPRERVPEFAEFQRATELLQALQDRGDIRFIRDDKPVELAAPIPTADVTPASVIQADQSGYKYIQRPDKSWILTKNQRRLELNINPIATASPEMVELCQILHLKPSLTEYEITVGAGDVFPVKPDPEGLTTINLTPRSSVQAWFYLSHGVQLPIEHIKKGVVGSTMESEGCPFDWQQVTTGLFSIHTCKQHLRPKHAWVAVRYRDWWYYVDDRDNDSKISFTLTMVMARTHLLEAKKNGPTLTLPVGR